MIIVQQYTYICNVLVNQLGYGAQQKLNGQSITAAGSAATFVGTSLGYGVGYAAPKLLNPYVSITAKQAFNANKPFYNNYAVQKPIFGKYVPKWFKPVPSFSGTVADPFIQELTTPIFQQKFNKWK